MSLTRLMAVAGVLLAVSLSAHAAQQQAWPTRPVRLIVSNAPGSAPDTIARLVAAKLGEIWGHQVVIDNRPGATGLISADLTYHAAPDGYTLWMNTMTQLIATLQAQKHMLAKDFESVSLVGSTPFVIVVNLQMPVKSIAELIAYARSRPGQLHYASAGLWGSSHMCMEALTSMAGIQMLHVPYKSSTQALTDIVAGRIHTYCPAAPGLPMFAGKVRAIAQTYLKPSSLAPGLPPVADTLSGFELLGWYGMQAPPKTPKALVAKINADLVTALKSPEVKDRMLAVGAEPVGNSPEAHADFLRKETARWDKVLKQAGGARLPQWTQQ
jgi:tripartite-type tricarboxylate transporter receptor subunit TctC